MDPYQQPETAGRRSASRPEAGVDGRLHSRQTGSHPCPSPGGKSHPTAAGEQGALSLSLSPSLSLDAQIDQVDQTLKKDLNDGLSLSEIENPGMGLEQDPKRRRVSDEGTTEPNTAGNTTAVEGASRLGGYLLRKRRAESCAESYLQLKELAQEIKNEKIQQQKEQQELHEMLEQKEQKEQECLQQDGHAQLVQTRAMAKRSIDWLGMLPQEMWAEILSHLAYTDIGKAMCVCKTFSEQEPYVWRLACANQWPELTERMATVPDRMFKNQRSRWRKCYEMLSLRAAENKLVRGWGNTFASSASSASSSEEGADALPSLQREVTPHFRSVLVEWMIEVAQEWKLESTMIFQATRYLDHYLRTVEVTDIGKFQLVGISALRLAVSLLRPQMKISPEQHACLMDPARYAAVCDGAATEEEVVATTDLLAGMVSKEMCEAPNAKMYLRCLWYTMSKTGIAGCTTEDMHVYVLAAFLLELGQTDVAYSTHSHSSLAGASMSLALQFYGKDPWPLELLAFSSYTSECLAEQRKVLARAQAMTLGSNVRDIWCGFYQNHLYHDRRAEWDRSLALMGRRGPDFVGIAFGADVAERLRSRTGRQSADAISFRGQEALELAMIRILV